MTTQKILCVHDAARELKELRGALETAGYIVLPAKNGGEALEALSSGEVDGVVLDFDVRAPGGITLRNRIRQAFPEMPLLLFAHVDEIKKMPLSVFRAYLEHPGPPDSLVSILSKN